MTPETMAANNYKLDLPLTKNIKKCFQNIMQSMSKDDKVLVERITDCRAKKRKQIVKKGAIKK
jgi:hypothetical protein